MNGQKEEKLKKLLESIPPGFLVDSAWMNKQNISRTSVYDYVKRGWLERLAQGVFRRPFLNNQNPSTEIDWPILILSLQQIMKYEVHVGGMTALTREGHTHYASLGHKDKLYIYGSKIPNWVTRIPLSAQIETRTGKLFNDDKLGIEGADFDLSDGINEVKVQMPWQWPMVKSSPERAILEALDELPDRESFHNIDMVFEGLVNLRPRSLMALLKDCRRIKVKRLFFLYADRHSHAWRRHLSEEAINLGTGDRSLVKGGRLHPTYHITVPPEFVERHREDLNGD